MATIEEIAREAGVSIMTVSNVLNGRNKEVRPSAARRAEQIRAIAARLNYRPNTAARAVRTGTFGNIGLLLSSNPAGGFLFQETERAIALAVQSNDRHLSLGHMPDETLNSDGFVPKMVREWAVDGLLINYTHSSPDRLRQLIEQHHIPAVWMNLKQQFDCIYPDDYGAGWSAAEYLMGLGHRRIAYIDYTTTPTGHYSADDRRLGCRDAMEEAGLELRVISQRESVHRTEWLNLSQEWLSGADRPTAVVAYEADHATPIYCAALKLGLDVPGDLSILTFHDQPTNYVGQRISYLGIPAIKMGNVGVEMLLEKIACPQTLIPARPLPFQPVIGETCCAA